ncbi:hypothetical protein [Fimbriiglobus ruber]|uniref:Uncharacterized protein n=1 Tax=Fimbriiglobus ruber TaxID=1908690 RepID=A0A225E0J7_9BACT|nr:hypothetical protein [Fimbriiglobus ruber]OWK45324.1 hypothetical protein FRUB_01655 [Fimbriiglobus ruber]
MSDGDLEQKTIYLIGLSPDDERRVTDDFLTYPFPGWRVAPLAVGAAPPLDVVAGQSVLVVGLGRGPALGSVETMWLLRLFVCGCPWVAVAYRADRFTRARCELAGAATYLTWPFGPPTLRELIWRHAVSHAAGDTVPPSLTCHRLARYLAAIGSDVLLKFSAHDGRIGYLAVRGGAPVSAQILNGPSGEDALRDLLAWRAGQVFGHALPGDHPGDLPDQSQSWSDAVGVLPDEPAFPGGQDVCDRLVHELPDVISCAVVDLLAGRVAAVPSSAAGAPAADDDFGTAVSELLRPVVPEEGAEWSDEVLVRTADQLWVATWLRPDPFALVLSVAGAASLGRVRLALAGAAAPLQSAGLLVEDTRTVG